MTPLSSSAEGGKYIKPSPPRWGRWLEEPDEGTAYEDNEYITSE